MSGRMPPGALSPLEVPLPWRIVRAVLAVTILAALCWSFVLSLRDGTSAQNISYFTNQSNLLLAIVLLAGAAFPRERLPRWWDWLRGAAAFYLVMTGLVYALVVAPLSELLQWDIGWTGIVLHRLAPVLALLDWALAPILRDARWRRPLGWLAYPVAYLLLTWLRGAFTGWYPYDFLDPTGAGGWRTVGILTTVVLAAFLAVAAILHLLGRMRARRTAEVTSGTSPGSRDRSSPASPSRT